MEPNDLKGKELIYGDTTYIVEDIKLEEGLATIRLEDTVSPLVLTYETLEILFDKGEVDYQDALIVIEGLTKTQFEQQEEEEQEMILTNLDKIIQIEDYDRFIKTEARREDNLSLLPVFRKEQFGAYYYSKTLESFLEENEINHKVWDSKQELINVLFPQTEEEQTENES